MTLRYALVLAVAFLPQPVCAETPDEWIRLGTRIHGGFGSHIAVGLRIGADAMERLKPGPRELTITYYSGEKAPCPCVADGIMLSTGTSPGQGSLAVAAEKAPAGLMGSALVQHRKTGAILRYDIVEDWLGKLADMNKTLDPIGRYHAVRDAKGLFAVTGP
jgi:formylmethanofuran dehydrogenase subunit E